MAGAWMRVYEQKLRGSEEHAAAYLMVGRARSLVMCALMVRFVCLCEA